MSLSYSAITNLPAQESIQRLTVRDTILYALGVGAGEFADGTDLKFTYEDGLRCLPTMATAVAQHGFWLQDPQYGVDWRFILHGEQSLTVHQELPVEGEICSVLTVDELLDKGPGKAAILWMRRQLYDRRSGDLLATDRHSWILRESGGFGGPAAPPPRLPAVPLDRPFDESIRLGTLPTQALIYRLSGDYNPLHVDPRVAASAGFSRPILHGLCTYGFAGRALLRVCCGNEPDRFRQMDVRFSSPVYPGETLRVDVWRIASEHAAFQVRTLERNVVVLDCGRFRFRAL